MKSFAVYCTPKNGAGYFLSGDASEGFSGTYRLDDASTFKTQAEAEQAARNYVAVGAEWHVLQQTGKSSRKA
jgi:hypothetical protein